MSDSEGWEDDDMAELFSFGNEGGAPPKDGPGQDDPTPSAGVPAEPSVIEENTTPERVLSSDSILDMLDGDIGTETSALGDTSSPAVPIMQDQDAQDILNWLDEEETPVASESEGSMVTEETKPVESKEDAKKEEEEEEKNKDLANTVATSTEPTPTIAVIPPPTKSPPIYFDSLEDALDSQKSTIDDLRALFVDGGMKVDPSRRAALWCRTVCGKTLEDVESSSLAESFLDWKQMTNIEEGDDARSIYIRKEAGILAERIVAGASSPMTLDEAKRALCQVLFFYYQSSSLDSQEVDPLLPPVACAILSSGLSPAATTVMLPSIMPSFMPLLALSQDDRWEAAKSLHTQFYLLACYHLPLLVFHLDRYAPGWFWPKKLGLEEENESATEMGRNLESHGIVPQSWLISHLAGECGGTLMNPVWLLSLWDLILSSSNNSLRFFLSLAILEKYSDTLLMLTAGDLITELKRIMEFKEGTTPEGFAIVAEEETSETEAGDWVQEWCYRARALWEATPRSVVSQLRTAEDEAVKKVLLQRQKKAEEKLQARLEAEAKAHREAVEAEKERKAEEARLRLSRARLVAYYRTHNPEKEGNIDKIMEVYKGRLDVLDMKLKSKYGVSFKPALKPKPNATVRTQKLLSSMNQGLNSARAVDTSQKKTEPHPGDPEHRVAVKVLATEVLPVICWSKEAAASRGVRALAHGRYNDEHRVPLKFFLVDSRPESTAEEQGRFPTAVVVSPETLLDPEKIEENEEMFESLRGAVHICVMGEGFSAVPHLYNQKMTPKLQHYIDEDESRTSLCALFFIKKGFPFVSILDGGFVQAHAWLCREGPKRHLDAASVLVDYDENNSFFGKLEKSYRTQQELANASAREKTQHVLQSFLDSSMTTLTRTAQRVENAAADVEASERKFRKSLSNIAVATEQAEEEVEEEESFVGSPVSGSAEDEDDATKESEGSFVSRFAGKLSNLKPEKDTGETSEKTDAGEKEQTADGAEPMFKNPFAGFRKAEAATGTGVGDSESGETRSDTVFRNPFAARRSVVPEKGQSDGDKTDDTEIAKVLETVKKEQVDDPDLVDVTIASSAESNKQGTFSRFARAATSTIQKVGEQQSQASQNAFKRYQFGRFGAKQAEKPGEVESKKPSNRFGAISMNQLRMNTLSNLRGKPSADEKEDDLVEESISFDHDATKETNEGADSETKTKKPSEKPVIEAV